MYDSYGIGEFLLITIIFIVPLILTILNIINIFKKNPIKEKLVDRLTFVLGIILSALLWTEFSQFDYNEPLILGGGSSTDYHTPIATWHEPTVLFLAFIAIVGYFILSKKLGKLPPIMSIICISSIYIGIALCTVFVIQMSKNIFSNFLCIYMMLFPINYILCSIRLIRKTVNIEVQRIKENNITYKSALLTSFSKYLERSLGWYLIPFILAIPLLGIQLIILILFGQKPDAIIKAFTETSDWTLSQKVSPPPVMYEGHYLCTVAVNGHPQLVKPTRCGIRYGVKIVVNRQLCIANAFEQLIQEKTPKLHKFIRTNYDKYGYPLSKHITTAKRADFTYLVMKPLEWLFLFVLYLCDKNPENRIAMQYTGKSKPLT